MKKSLILVMSLVLMLGLVACNPAKKLENKANSVTSKKVEFMALKDKTVLVNNGKEQGVIVLDTQENLIPGHKYEYGVDKFELKDPLKVENLELSGKAIGAKLQMSMLEKVVEKVKTVKLVDTRKAEEFAKGHIKGSINIPADKVQAALQNQKDPNASKNLLKGLKSDDVVILVGGAAPETNQLVAQELLYRVGQLNVILDAGDIKEYKGKLEK